LGGWEAIRLSSWEAWRLEGYEAEKPKNLKAIRIHHFELSSIPASWLASY